MPRPSERRRFMAAAGGTLAGAALPALAAREPIRLGQSVPLSGPAQALGIEYQRGLRLAFDAANAEGGVDGRSIELISYDDGYEPETALANTRDLLEADRVAALVGYVGTEQVQRCLPLAVKAGLPFIAPLTGAEALRREPPRALFHLRPGLSAEARLIVQALQTLSLNRIALLVQDDADGEAGVEALQAQGLPAPVAVARVGRNATGQVELRAQDTQAAARRLAAAQPQALICLAAHASTAAVLKAVRELGFAGPCYATSLSSTAAMGALLGARAAGLCVTQVVPSPFDDSRPVVAAYQKRLRAAGVLAPEYVSLEGWLAGRATVHALRRLPASGHGGGTALMAALESLGGVDLGGFVLRWDATRRQVSSQVALTVLDATGKPRR